MVANRRDRGKNISGKKKEEKAEGKRQRGETEHQRFRDRGRVEQYKGTYGRRKADESRGGT